MSIDKRYAELLKEFNLLAEAYTELMCIASAMNEHIKGNEKPYEQTSFDVWFKEQENDERN